jgi:hypothetical protein
VHRQPRAKIQFFLCAVRWFTGQLLCAVRCAPDRHCRLSGAPISRFKKGPPARPSQRLLLFPSQHPLLSVPGDSLSPTGVLRSPASLRRPGALRDPFNSGEQSFPLSFPLSSLLSVLKGSVAPHCPSLNFLSNLANPVGGMCSIVSSVYPCRFLAPSGGFSYLKWPFP